MALAPPSIYVGCAGWSLPAALRPAFGEAGSHLQRYATRLGAVEINSSFYRPHQRATYERWAAGVPEDFRFSVKLPQALTHERRLDVPGAALEPFLHQVQGLGQRLGCLLVQLPPSLPFERGPAGRFFRALRRRHRNAVAVEPRHASWFAEEADALLRSLEMARVLADPVRHEAGRWPGGAPQPVYLRLHGSPRMYYSRYTPGLLRTLARRIVQAQREGAEVWCIFDNTASGAATDNALGLQQALDQETAP